MYPLLLQIITLEASYLVIHANFSQHRDLPIRQAIHRECLDHTSTLYITEARQSDVIREERYENVRRECTRSRILLRDSGKVDTRRLVVEVVGRVGQVDAFASNHGYVNACSSELDVAAELDIAERRLLRLKWRLSGFELVVPNFEGSLHPR